MRQMVPPSIFAETRTRRQAKPGQMVALGRCLLLRSLLVPVGLVACGNAESDERHASPVCSVVAPTECPDPAPRYADVAPIFSERCASCHTGVADGPWPLDTYDRVADWAAVVRDELLSCSMPPDDSGVTMSPEERNQILVWLQCGNPD